MKPQIQSALFRACEKFLPAIVRLLLPSGINCRQFVEMAKRAYVDVVTEEYGINGRPANISKTAVLTGLTRPEVTRIRKLKASDPAMRHPDERRYNMTELLMEWHNETFWCDPKGKPLDLPMKDGARSFEALVRRHFGNVPVTAVLRELREAGAVALVSDDVVRVMRSFYQPDAMTPAHAERVGQLIYDFVDTVQTNLYPHEDLDERVEYKTQQKDVPVRHQAVFNSLLSDETRDMCARIDQWLSDKKRFESKPGEPTVRMGFGIYQIGDD